ncbi:hypothetical protein WJX73_008617 [Symbiochloris irregularis]|uniref:FATC domain-containing protein n=1 Tax=Symbiochloris irregularis TaxID=706552 RepID=A0AAW1P0Q0_9CHLO
MDSQGAPGSFMYPSEALSQTPSLSTDALPRESPEDKIRSMGLQRSRHALIQELDLHLALEQQGGLVQHPVPAIQGQEGGQTLQLRRRMVLLGALQQALTQLPALSAQLDTWTSQSAGIEAQLRAAVQRVDPKLLPALQAALEQRRQWLITCREQATAIQQDAEGILQFESSRMGISWSLAGGREEDLSLFNASCTQLQKNLSVAADAQQNGAEAARELQELQQALTASTQALQHAQAEHGHLAHALSDVQEPLQRSASELSTALQSVLQCLPEEQRGLTDAGAALLDLRKSMQGHESMSGLLDQVSACLQHQQLLSTRFASLPADLQRQVAALHGPLSALREEPQRAAPETVAALVNILGDAAEDDCSAQVLQEGASAASAMQVLGLIKDATDVDNLCCMYEGWTPWM